MHRFGCRRTLCIIEISTVFIKRDQSVEMSKFGSPISEWECIADILLINHVPEFGPSLKYYQHITNISLASENKIEKIEKGGACSTHKGYMPCM